MQHPDPKDEAQSPAESAPVEKQAEEKTDEAGKESDEVVS